MLQLNCSQLSRMRASARLSDHPYEGYGRDEERGQLRPMVVGGPTLGLPFVAMPRTAPPDLVSHLGVSNVSECLAAALGTLRQIAESDTNR